MFVLQLNRAELWRYVLAENILACLQLKDFIGFYLAK